MRFIVGLVLLLSLCSQAQTNDAVLWTGASVKLDITKDLRLDYETQTRFYKNVSTLSNYYNELSLKYDLAKGLDIGGTYRYARKNRESHFTGENRLCLNLSYGIKTNGFKFSGRARYQYSFERWKVINDEIYPQNSSVFRFKFETSYKNDNLKRISPFLSTEWFSALNPKGNFGLTDAYRLSFGVDLDLPKKMEVKLAYIFEKEISSMISLNHIYVVQFTYAIPGKLISKKGKG